MAQSVQQSVPTGTVEFIQYHQPALKDGDYVLTAKQKIRTQTTQNIPETEFTAALRFNVAGERFALNPTDIHAVFPPAGSLGEHSNVLPHITLTRSTLPWERFVEADQNEAPWLALLIFDDAEKPEPHMITLAELLNTAGYAAEFPVTTLEVGQESSDRVSVIDVQKSVLQKIMPSLSDLKLAAHVRLGKDDQGVAVGDEMAVIIANRLPVKNGMTTAHLVGLEYRFNGPDFDYMGAGDDDLIRLVSLKSWSFACLDAEQSFKGLLENLDRAPATLRLPDTGTPSADAFLAQGYAALPHLLRRGHTTASWYRGPFIPGDNTDAVTLPVRASDELLRYNPANGMLDVSYAAAWELGRLLALNSHNFSTQLYCWKRAHAQSLTQAEQRLLHPHLPYNDQNAAPDIPQSITDWFDDLSVLKGVPFNYLVHDERMLPKESIRFFRVDGVWIECLLDGAFSIGRVASADYNRDVAHTERPSQNPYATVSGFLLRSEVVAGWPNLEVDAYDVAIAGLDFIPVEDRLVFLRCERLSPNVLLCLFQGEIQTADIHQKPEGLHFGLDVNVDPDPPGYHKALRDNQGQQTGVSVDTIPWKNSDPAARVVDLTAFAAAIQTARGGGAPLTSALFGLEMVEGVEKVRFVKGS